jgi:hypothetical protein
VISIMAPIPDPQETLDLQGRTARGSTFIALWGQPSARLAAAQALAATTGLSVLLLKSSAVRVRLVGAGCF